MSLLKSIRRFKKLFIGINVLSVNNILEDPSDRLRCHCYISGYDAVDTERCHRILLRMKIKPFYTRIWNSSSNISRDLINDIVKYTNHVSGIIGNGVFVMKTLKYNYKLILLGLMDRYRAFIRICVNGQERRINAHACRDCLKKYIADEPLVVKLQYVISTCSYCESSNIAVMALGFGEEHVIV